MNDQLRQFVNQKRAAGFSDGAIATELIAAGWDSSVIDAALGRNHIQPASNPQQGNRKVMLSIAAAMVVLIGVGGFLALRNSENGVFQSDTDIVSGSIDNLAIPELQRSRRDTIRKNDVGRLLAAVENYAANNNGLYPDSSDTSDLFSQGYLDAEDWVDPQTEVTYKFTNNPAPSAAEIFYDTGYFCESETPSQGPLSSKRNVAVAVQLEDSSLYCQDNQ